MNLRKTLQYAAAAIVVTVLGGLLGWYLFVSKSIETTGAQDAARGFGGEQSFGGSIGSALGNLVGGIVDDITGGGVEPATSKAPKLWQVTRTPVAGLGFASTSTRLFFAERASGNVLAADPTTGKVERLTNTLIPRVHEALFAGDGSVVLRAIDERGAVTSYAATIATSTSPATGDTPNKLEGVYLPENIVSIAARSTPRELFFILRDAQGSAGITSNWSGGAQKRILGSALSDWNATLLSDGTKYVVQRASDDVSGYAFKILPSGALERVIGDLPGLQILPRSNSTALLYSTVSNGALTLFGRVNDKSVDIRLPVRTIVEKCVWVKDTQLIAYCAVPQGTQTSSYLQSRYDGSAHTTDAWWRVDVSANTAEQIYTPDASIVIDVENPHLDSTGRYIAFMNMADKTLWMLTLDD